MFNYFNVAQATGQWVLIEGFTPNLWFIGEVADSDVVCVCK